MGINECTSEARKSFSVVRIPRSGIASRQDEPIGVELERGDLGGGQIAVISLAGLIGQC